MKFLVSKKLSKKSPIFPPLIGLLLFFLIGIGMNFAYIDSKLSLIPHQMIENILGNEDAYIEPILPEELLSIVHVELLFFMFVTLLVFFIYYRLYQTRANTIKKLVITFVLVQGALLSLGFAQVVGSIFVYLFFFSFIAANSMLIYITLSTFLGLIRNE